MTLIEAVKSGKRFKRSKWHDFYSMDDLCICGEDVLATDWEIEGPKPKRRLYLTDVGSLYVMDQPPEGWKPLTRAEFDALFEGE